MQLPADSRTPEASTQDEAGPWQALRESEARKTAILNASLDVVITIDHTGSVLEVNPVAERVFGYRAEEMVGRDMADLIVPPQLREAHRRGMRHFLATGEGPVLGKRLELPAIRKNGEQFPIELAITRIPLEGPPMFTGHIRDITERKAAEAELRRSRDEAERANGAKNEFLSRMSHELRTPLNAILGFAQLVMRTELDTRQKESVKHILRAGDHLLTLINEVLDLARIDAGQLSISPEAVSVQEVLREALVLVQPQCAEMEIRCVADGGRHHVRADRQRLKQVLVNLLSNASKYNRRGGEIEVRCAPTAEGRLAISVRDSGIGMGPDFLERLFIPFERLGRADVEDEGTGIGLAISKRLVEAMEGSLTVRSEMNVGSTFTLELPSLETPEDFDELEEDDASPVGGENVAARRRILYVEDNSANLRLMEKIMEDRAELYTCTRGEESLQCALQCRPELILLDLHLPGMPGETVLQRVHAEPRLAGVPIVIVSADAMPRQIARLRALGAVDYLTKPLNIDQVLAAVDRHLPALTP